MTGGNKLVFIVVFTTVFVIIFSTALLSDVSLSASLIRAVTAATFFTVMLWGIFKIVNCFILSGIKPSDEVAASGDVIGQNLNITVTDTFSNEQTADILRDNDVLDANNKKIGNNDAASRQHSPEAADSFEEFTPLATRQIDPQIEKIINNDPKRLAEIVKKMGFED